MLLQVSPQPRGGLHQLKSAKELQWDSERLEMVPNHLSHLDSGTKVMVFEKIQNIDDVFFDGIEFCKDGVRPKNVHKHFLQRDIGLQIHGWEKQGRGEKLKDVQQIELETLTSNLNVLT